MKQQDVTYKKYRFLEDEGGSTDEVEAKNILRLLSRDASDACQ